MTRAKSARDRKAKAGNGKAENSNPNVEAPVDDTPFDAVVIISADHLIMTQHGEDGRVLIRLVDDEANGAFILLDIDQITSLGKTCAHIVMEQRLEDAGA